MARARSFQDRDLYDAFCRLKAKASLTHLNDMILDLTKARPEDLLPVRGHLEYMVRRMKQANTANPVDIAALKVTEAVLNLVRVKTAVFDIKVTVTADPKPNGDEEYDHPF